MGLLPAGAGIRLRSTGVGGGSFLLLYVLCVYVRCLS